MSPLVQKPDPKRGALGVGVLLPHQAFIAEQPAGGTGEPVQLGLGTASNVEPLLPNSQCNPWSERPFCWFRAYAQSVGQCPLWVKSRHRRNLSGYGAHSGACPCHVRFTPPPKADIG